jgi:hypothetical protein
LGNAPQVGGKVAAILSRQNDIRQQQSHYGFVFVECRYRFRSGVSLQHPIARGLENFARHLTEEAFIFH